MTYKGPEKYPGASLAYWFQTKYPGDRMESNVVVWHTTEGTSVPGYDGGSVAPNFTALPDFYNRKLLWYQHFDVDCSARALVNLSGGVETNTLNACQVELVGTCDPSHRTSWGSRKAGTDYLYWPDAPDWALAEVAEMVKWLHDNHGIKMTSSVNWKAYPGSYGASNGVRLTSQQWLNYYGHLGHQHVPENLHGDPGNLDFARVLQLASNPAVAEEDEVTPDDISKITASVLAALKSDTGLFSADVIPAVGPPNNNSDYFAADGTTLANTKWGVTYAIGTIADTGRSNAALLKDVQDRVTVLDSRTQALADALAHVQLAGVDLDALAAKVADVLAQRLSG